MSPITNGPFAGGTLRQLKLDEAFVYVPTTSGFYSHHAQLGFVGDRLVTIWSSGEVGEDEPGQKVVASASTDFFHWTEPQVLATPLRGAGKKLEILTAGGMYPHDGTLTAYFGKYDVNRNNTAGYAMTTRDGLTWTEPVELGVPVVPNRGPVPISSGRLLLPGNFSFSTTDDPTGVRGWQYAGIQPPKLETLADNEWTANRVSTSLHFRGKICEGAAFQTDDGVIHMMLRDAGPVGVRRLYEATSVDEGRTWSKPLKTSFTDNDAKFDFGRLPDGRYYYVGNPDPTPRGARSRLVLSLSKDGVQFTDHWLIADTPYKRKREGNAKSGQYGYPNSFVRDGMLYVVCSRMKEAIEVFRIPLDQLAVRP